MAKRTTSKANAPTLYTLCQASDVMHADGGRTLSSVYTEAYGGVSVAESAGLLWVERMGQFTRNERYDCVSQVLQALGAHDDKPVWRLVAW